MRNQLDLSNLVDVLVLKPPRNFDFANDAREKVLLKTDHSQYFYDLNEAPF